MSAAWPETILCGQAGADAKMAGKRALEKATRRRVLATSLAGPPGRFGSASKPAVRKTRTFAIRFTPCQRKKLAARSVPPCWQKAASPLLGTDLLPMKTLLQRVEGLCSSSIVNPAESAYNLQSGFGAFVPPY
jgi:hypothetical protein